MLADMNGRPAKMWRTQYDEPMPRIPPRSAFVNADAGHMAAGLDDHMDHLRRLAARGERDES